jgi:carotenoid cleavage dioxygenase
MIHDCAITKNYLILPLTPIKANLDRLKKGGNHFAWDPNEDQWYGIVPRRNGKPEDIVWLRADNGTLLLPYCLLSTPREEPDSLTRLG